MEGRWKGLGSYSYIRRDRIPRQIRASEKILQPLDKTSSIVNHKDTRRKTESGGYSSHDKIRSGKANIQIKTDGYYSFPARSAKYSSHQAEL